MVVGSVPYLNAVPLTWALHKIGFRGTLVFGTPAQLSSWMEQGKIDAGLIPLAEYLRGVGSGIVADVSLAADGAVRSVLLVSKVPLFQIETVAVDRGSRSSVLLLKVILAERYGNVPVLFPMEPNLDLMLTKADAALLIGDAALLAQTSLRWQVIDLGQEWKELTGLPFVFAAWVIRGGANETELADWLVKSKIEGLRNLDIIVAEEVQKRNLDKSLVHHYLTECIKYDLTESHIESIRTFNRLCVKHRFLPEIRSIRLIGAV
ncbi:MAG: menaquinone biosynthetic enzyme MqnA/MqnD family protein [Armatimonadota bacterium]